MRRKIAAFLAMLLFFTNVCSVGADTVSLSDDSAYSKSYGEQVVSTYGRFFYNKMVESYIYQPEDEGNEDGKLTGLAEPVTDGNISLQHSVKLTDVTVNTSRETINDVLDNWLQSESQVIFAGFGDAFNGFVKDYPQVFWMYSTGIKIGMSASTKQTGIVSGSNGISRVYDVDVTLKFTIEPTKYFTNCQTYIEEFNQTVLATKEALIKKNNISETTPKDDIAKYIYEYVIDQVDYNYDAAGAGNMDVYGYAFTPVPVFLTKPDAFDNKVVCEGYSKAYKILCDQLNVECTLLLGNALTSSNNYGPHMWNAVKMPDEQWYLVDSTWGDQKTINYTYFLAGQNTKGYYKTCKEDHLATGKFSTSEGVMEFAYPLIADEKYSGSISVESTAETESEAQTPESVTDVVSETTSSENKETTSMGNIGNQETTSVIISGPGTEDKTDPVIETPIEEESSSNVEIETNIDEEHWIVNGIKDVYYTGGKIKFNIKITCKDKELTNGKDYIISYKNNVKAGTGTVIITPMDKSLSNQQIIFNFKIKKVKVGQAVAKSIKAQKYRKGKAVKPKIKLTYKGRVLKKGKDYTVKYKNNRKKGIAKAIVKGKGNFYGVKIIKYKIK